LPTGKVTQEAIFALAPRWLALGSQCALQRGAVADPHRLAGLDLQALFCPLPHALGELNLAADERQLHAKTARAGDSLNPHVSRLSISENPDAIMERMNEALKKMMDTPHETQKEMIARRRQGEAKPKARKTKA
jgi:hypothetical protein